MSDLMTTLSVRIDQSLLNAVKENAATQGIKLSRYARSLIERGLMLEKLEDHSISNNNKSIDYLPIIATLCAENTMLTRYLYRKDFSNQPAFNAALADVFGQSQHMLKEMETMQQKENE